MDLVSASVEKLQPLPPSEAGGGGPRPADGGEKDAAWLEDMEERAERGIAEAQFSLGQYRYDRGDYGSAVKYFELAADKASMQAKYQLGVMHYDGVGVAVDPAVGFRFMLEVAQSGRKRDTHLVPSAQYNIGRAYFQGFGVRQSDSEAVRWWEAAAKAGAEESSVRAQNTLGMYYSRAESLDLEKSFYWHSEAAKNGHLESVAAGALMLLEGRGCGRDEELGLQWMRRSAEGGCVYGTGLLALHYYSRKLFSKAAETAFRVSEIEDQPTISVSPLDHRGIAVGCFVLARCLQLGHAVSRNNHKAQEYFIKAKSHDKATVAELYDRLTHGQL